MRVCGVMHVYPRPFVSQHVSSTFYARPLIDRTIGNETETPTDTMREGDRERRGREKGWVRECMVGPRDGGRESKRGTETRGGGSRAPSCMAVGSNAIL